MSATVIVTTPAELRRLVAEAVRDAVRAELPGLVQEATRKPYLTPREVRDLTGWSSRTLQHLRDTRQVPFVQSGRKVLYPTDGVDDFLARNTVVARRARRP